jgi:hypothetical protein
MRLHVFVALAASLALAACGGGSSARGNASYDRPIGEGGEPVKPQPRQEDLEVSIDLSASANFDPVNELLCELTSGDILFHTESNGRIESDGRYRADFSTEAEGDTTITHALCQAVENLEFENATTFTMLASIPASPENCEDFCRAGAESQCSPGNDTCVANFIVECEADCDDATRIRGSGSMTAEAASELNSRLGDGSSNLEAEVNLVFDTLD